MFDKLVDLIINFISLFKFFRVVRDFEGGIILRLGRFHRMATPGFHWVWPFNVEELFYANTNMLTRVVGPQSLTTRDDTSVVISVVITEKIEDVKKFLIDVTNGHSVIEDATFGAVATLIHNLTWDELRAGDIAHQLEISVRRQARKYGVDIIQLQLVDFTKTKSLRLMQAHVEGLS